MFFIKKMPSSIKAAKERRITALQNRIVALYRLVQDLAEDYRSMQDDHAISDAAFNTIKKRGFEVEKEMYIAARMIAALNSDKCCSNIQSMKKDIKREFYRDHQAGHFDAISEVIDEQLKVLIK